MATSAFRLASVKRSLQPKIVREWKTARSSERRIDISVLKTDKWPWQAWVVKRKALFAKRNLDRAKNFIDIFKNDKY